MMQYTEFGRTGLRVSVAGLGCGGFSRLGQARGMSVADSVALVRLALDSGINLLDTAAVYGTEEIVGQAIAAVPRDSVVVTTKALVMRDGTPLDADAVLASLDASLRRLGTDHVDVFQLHGVLAPDYDRVRGTLVPALLRAREAGKFRFLGVTESGANDPEHAMLMRAVDDDVWDSMMVAFNMLHRTAIDRVFPGAIAGRVGTLVMHAVRGIFAQPAKLAEAIQAMARAGRVSPALADDPAPLDFLVHPGGAESLTDAAYRFARHTPGVSVVLFGTGSAAHLRANVASLLRPQLPPADLRRLLDEFAAVSGLGLEGPGRPAVLPGTR